MSEGSEQKTETNATCGSTSRLGTTQLECQLHQGHAGDHREGLQDDNREVVVTWGRDVASGRPIDEIGEDLAAWLDSLTREETRELLALLIKKIRELHHSAELGIPGIQPK